MKCDVVLDAGVPNEINNFNLTVAKRLEKLCSVLEARSSIGDIGIVALSGNCLFLAISIKSRNPDINDELFVLHLLENRFTRLMQLSHGCTAAVFHSLQEPLLLLATGDGSVHLINVVDGAKKVMVGHHELVTRISIGLTHIVTFGSNEVLLWDWPHLELSNQLRLEEEATVVWVGQTIPRNEVLVGFSNGSVILWDFKEGGSGIPISAPAGVHMDFHSFAISVGGDWLVGGGSGRLVVTYSLLRRSAFQVVQLPKLCPDAMQLDFLPLVHPNFMQVLSVLSSNGSLHIIDFSCNVKLKMLRSHKFKIESFAFSADGGLMAVTYSSGSTKLYPMLALLPSATDVVKLSTIPETTETSVGFQVVHERDITQEQHVDDKHKDDIRNLLDGRKWSRILREFGEYPSKYRTAIWSSLLSLPCNFSVYSNLLDKGVHIAFTTLKDVLPLSDQGLFTLLQSTLSCLAHWAPFLASVEYLPELVFPFVKAFANNALHCFEVCVSVIYNWCRLWFECWPSANVTLLKMIEHMLYESDPSLMTHLMKLRVVTEDYVWPLLTSAFSQVFAECEWYILWDHIMTNHLAFLPCVAAAFILESRLALISCTHRRDVKLYCVQETYLKAKVVIKKACNLFLSMTTDCLPKEMFGTFYAIPNGALPVFNIGPREEMPKFSNTKRMDMQFSTATPEISHLRQSKEKMSGTSKANTPKKNLGEI